MKRFIPIIILIFVAECDGVLKGCMLIQYSSTVHTVSAESLYDVCEHSEPGKRIHKAFSIGGFAMLLRTWRQAL